MTSRVPGGSHRFEVSAQWHGPGEHATDEVRRFARTSSVTASARAGAGPSIEASAARAFFGDEQLWNPETLLLSALAQCHMLAFLRTAGLRGYRVSAARVDVEGTLELGANGAGRFTGATLTPVSQFEPGTPPPDAEAVRELHAVAHRQCFIANSLAFQIDLAGEAAELP